MPNLFRCPYCTGLAPDHWPPCPHCGDDLDDHDPAFVAAFIVATAMCVVAAFLLT